MNLLPVTLKNNGNICWWNAFMQLFASTRDESIVNEMTQFIDEHKCDDENDNNEKCWYCNMFQTAIAIMIENNNKSYIGDFHKHLFEIPDATPDPKDLTKLIFHPFHVFQRNRQQDAMEGCDQWFEIVEKILPTVYNLFNITTSSQIKCNDCQNEHEPEIICQHALSVPISNVDINSIQAAVNMLISSI
jgi:uncharacterized UBP type Zn finger protein